MAKFVQSTKEAAKEGFKNIKKIRGLVVNMDVVPAPDTWGTSKQLFKIWMEDVNILDYFNPEDLIELKDNKLEISYTYAEPGQKPKAVSPYMKCLVASTEKMGKLLESFIGQVVTMEKIPVQGFKTKNKETGVEEVVMYEDYFSIVPDEGQDNPDTKNYIKTLISGLNVSAAMRKLMLDSRASQFPEFKDMLQKGTLAEYLGLKVVEDKFVEE